MVWINSAFEKDSSIILVDVIACRKGTFPKLLKVLTRLMNWVRIEISIEWWKNDDIVSSFCTTVLCVWTYVGRNGRWWDSLKRSYSIRQFFFDLVRPNNFNELITGWIHYSVFCNICFGVSLIGDRFQRGCLRAKFYNTFCSHHVIPVNARSKYSITIRLDNTLTGSLILGPSHVFSYRKVVSNSVSGHQSGWHLGDGYRDGVWVGVSHFEIVYKLSYS